MPTGAAGIGAPTRRAIKRSVRDLVKERHSRMRSLIRLLSSFDQEFDRGQTGQTDAEPTDDRYTGETVSGRFHAQQSRQTTLGPGGDRVVIDARRNDSPLVVRITAHRDCFNDRLQPEGQLPC